jgi:hypothetical protein
MKLNTLVSSLALRRHAHLTDSAPPPVRRQGDGSISPFNALLQIARVARARGMPIATLHALVADHTIERRVGGRRELRVDVRALNAALETASGHRRRPRAQFGSD